MPPFSLHCPPVKDENQPAAGAPSVIFAQIPTRAIFARYRETAPGVFQVVNISGKVLATSFYELRHRYTFGQSLNGSGCWVVLLPIEKPQPEQISMF